MAFAREDVLWWLRRNGACDGAVEWFRASGFAPAEAWDACERSDWLLWLAGRVGTPESTLRLCACDIAETVLKYVPAGEDRPRQAIEVARRYAIGEATDEELSTAWKSAMKASENAYHGATWSSCQSGAWTAYKSDLYYPVRDASSTAIVVATHAANSTAWGPANGNVWSAVWHDANSNAFRAQAVFIRSHIPASLVLGLLAEKLREEAHDGG
jgi:hypothetical protein